MTTLPHTQPGATGGERAPTASDQPERPDAASAEIRERVLDALELIGVPSPLKLLADVLAIQGHRVTLRQLARLRHAEQREHHASTATGERFLVPALSTLDLTALSGSIALSSWPAEQRLVGSRSPRVHHLRVLLALLDLDSPGELLSAMVARHAETIPGAQVRGEPRDLERVRAAAERELQALVSLDADERRCAAARMESLPPTYQLWGRPALLEGSLEATSEDQP
jgi:hypothetical protein